MTFAPQEKELAGTINSIISRSIIKAVYNDGDRTYLTLQQECKTNLPVTSDTLAIVVPLTNPNIDFVQFDKSYIHFTVTVEFQTEGYEKPSREAPVVQINAQNRQWTDTGLDVDDDAPEYPTGFGLATNANVAGAQARAAGQNANQIAAAIAAAVNPGHYDQARQAFDVWYRNRVELEKRSKRKWYTIFNPFKWFTRQPNDPIDVKKVNIRRALQTFIGLKNASDFLQEYAIFHKGKQVTGTLQSNATVESFLYHNFRSESDLAYKPHEHTVAQAARTFDQSSVCGRFASLPDLQAAMVVGAQMPAPAGEDQPIQPNPRGEGVIEATFEINIPFNDILPFQQFRTYPAALFGDLEIRFRVNPRAFVTLTCDPENCLRRFIEGRGIECMPSLTTIAKTFSLNGLPYEKNYTQLGDWFRTIHHCRLKKDTNNGNFFFHTITGLSRWSYKSINITQCHSILTGYRANPAALEAMRGKFMTQPWVKFSQNINYLAFPTRPMQGGFNQVVQTYLNECTDFIILFPTSENEARGTVFKNPALQDLSITALNRKLPEMGLDTTSPEYLEQLLISTDAYGKKPQRELIESVINPLWNNDSIIFSNIDRTSFVCAIKVERPSAMGLICDGLDSRGTQIPIRLQARPKYNERFDSYCGDPNSVVPPILITVNDSYWVFNAKDGGQCLYTSRPFNETVALFMAQ